MRVKFPASIIAALAAASLAACAHGAVRSSVAEGGEVALAPTVSPSRATTFAPITLAELAGRPDAAPTTGRAVRSTPALAAGLAKPAVSMRSGSTSDDGIELWQGNYLGRTYGQKGALALALRPTGGTVRGVVAWRVTRAAPGLGRGTDSAAVLVRVPVVGATRDSGQLVLHLDSYFDPACNCTAQATFRGTVRGDTLVGRFSVEGPATVVSEERGRWRAVRVMP